MYKVTIINDGVETTIHSPYVNDLKLPTGTIKREINLIDSFNFSFYMNNPGYSKIKPLKTLVNVLNTKTGKYEFEGRILGPSDNMESSGLVDVSYDCEGELGYLHDSQQQHLEFRGSPLELLTEILNYHNAQVEDYKKFEVGQVTVTNSTDNLYLYLSAEQDTFETIKDKLIDKLDGELQIRKENGVRFLDLLNRVGEDKETEIRIAKNLISMSRDIDPTKIITRLTPLGIRIESESATDASQARLTIESVNNGLPYLDDEALKAEFGIQGGSITWDDVTIADNLLTKGQEWLVNQKTAHVQYKLSALDLFVIGLDIDSFETGHSYLVKNPIMGIDERLRVIGKSLDINSPQDAALTIGDKFKTLNEYQSEANMSAQRVIDLQYTVNSQSQTIGALQNELASVNSAVTTINLTLEENDLPALEQAVSDLQDAINNLNEAIDSIPDYQPATQTADGLMSSTDKIKLDSLQNYNIATETTDGLMSSTDKVKLDSLENYDIATEIDDGLMSSTDKSKLNLITLLGEIDLDQLKSKLDLITVLNAVDLDDIVFRLEALENG